MSVIKKNARPLAIEPYDKEWGVGVSGLTDEVSPFPRINRILNWLKQRDTTADAQRALIYTEGNKKYAMYPQNIKCAMILRDVLQQVDIHIWPDELIVGELAAPPKSAPVYPEFSMEWLCDELINHPMDQRTNGRYVISDKVKEQLLSIREDWKGQTVSEAVLASYSEQELAGWTSRQGSSGRAILWQDDTLYWTADEDTGHISWLTAAGETGQTAVRWPDTLPVGQGWYVTPERLVDGRLLVTAMDPDTIIVHRCAVDLQTGAAQELTLRYVENATEQPVRVLAQSGDMVLVRFESQVRDGLAGGDTEVQNRCGLISLEDFFAGRPNYREITLHYARDFS